MFQRAARALAGRLGAGRLDAWGIQDAGGDKECLEELYTGSQGGLRASRVLAGRLGAWGNDSCAEMLACARERMACWRGWVSEDRTG